MLAVLDIMSRGAVLLSVNPRHPEIMLPDPLKKALTQVVCFGWGRYMKTPIDDMSIDALGIRGNLLFGHKNLWVDVPWGSVWRAYGPDDRLLMWGENMPEGMMGGVQIDAEVVQRLESQEKRRTSSLALVTEQPVASPVEADLPPAPVGVTGWRPVIVPRSEP